MTSPRPLPPSLGPRFSVQNALDADVNRGRLRRGDLEIPFPGARNAKASPRLEDFDPFERQAAERRIRAKRYAPLMKPGQFLSHESAVAMYGGPLPLVTFEGRAVDGMSLPVHVSTLGRGPLARTKGTVGHRANPETSSVIRIGGFAVASPASVWAQCATWNLTDLVTLGDFFCRVWRPGPGRKDVGRRSLATLDQLRAATEAGRRVGVSRLREAVELVREDSWSPRESAIRCHIVFAGLREPHLNHDVYDSFGRFIGCVDLAYPEVKVAIEYQSILHHARYAQDVERVAALRAAGWTVIEVTGALFANPDEMIRRIRDALER